MLDKFKPKSEFSSNVLTLMTGATIAQAIPIAISPILTRIYTPEDFGVFALFLAVTGLFSSVASGRYDLAIMLPKKDEDAINIFALGMIIITLLSLSLLVLVLLLNEYIAMLLRNEEISFWLYFVPVAVFFTGMFNLLSYFNNRKKNYEDIANATIIKSIMLAMVQLSVGFMKEGASGLISGQIVSSLFANLRLLRNILKDKLLIAKISKIEIISLAKQYKDFPQFQVPHTMLNTFSSHLPVYMFAPFFGLTVVGFYSLSIRMVFTPMMILAGASSKVYNQKVTELYNNNGDTYGFSIRLLKSLLKKVILPFTVLVIFAPQIFVFVFGKDWVEAGVYTQILAPWLLLNVIVSTVSFIPSLTNMQKKAFLVSIVYTGLISLAILIGVYYNSIYVSLFLYSFFASCVLLYNLRWMLEKLKGSH